MMLISGLLVGHPGIDLLFLNHSCAVSSMLWICLAEKNLRL